MRITIPTAVVIAVAVALVLEPGPRGQAAPVVDASSTIVVSRAESGSDRLLNGARLTGWVRIAVRSRAQVRKVKFYLDDPSHKGAPFRTAVKAPYDLMGTRRDGEARLFDTTRLEHGTHSLVAVLELVSGRSQTLRATFSVPRLFLAPSGSDSGSCTREAPCKSIKRGFSKALPGQVVELADGFYGCENVAGRKSEPVTFRAADEAKPWVQCRLTLVDVTNITFERIRIAGLVLTDTSDVTLRNVDITCEDHAPFALFGPGKCSADLHVDGVTRDFEMRGGSVGPTWDDPDSKSPGSSQVGIGGGANILLDGVWWHDNRHVEGAHTECLMVAGGSNVTIRNSRFTNCSVFAIFFTYWNWLPYPVARNITLENNVFGPLVSGFYAVRFSDWMPRFENVRVRYNTSFEPITVGTNPKSDVRFVGNVGPFSWCDVGIVYSHNVFSDDLGRKCGSSDRVVQGRHATGLRLNGVGRPLERSPVIGAGNPRDYPSRDITGRKRPKGRPDAGAYEVD